jgi:hypothetical protein
MFRDLRFSQHERERGASIPVFCPVDGDHLLAGVISVGVNVAVDGGGRRWTLDEVLYLGRVRTRD